MSGHKPKILIVDDEPSQRELLAGFLNKKGFSTKCAGSVAEAVEIFEREGFDTAVLDLKLPDGDGIELLKKLRAIDPDLGAIFLTAYATISSAVEGIRAGAEEFLEKPVELSQLEILLHKLTDHRKIIRENRALLETSEMNLPSEIVAESPQMKEIINIVARVAPTDAPVLITGESGTGKELIARMLHSGSNRKDKLFMPINCAAIPETLLESELFGYEPGAFTGARKRQAGKFEMASGGTVFLDEIGDFPALLQAKLLRFLEDGTFYRLGGKELISPDVRIISATNRDIEAMVKNNEFREDLYYRLNLIRIHIPPLRQRPEDLLKLSKILLKNFAKKHKKSISGFTEEARNRLLRYDWFGNVRELKNVIERAVILSRNEYIPANLIPSSGDEDSSDGSATRKIDLRKLADVEREHILAVLRYCDGNQTEAAKILGIHRNTLRNKLKEYGIEI